VNKKMENIARTIEDLPALKEGWVRLVHLCHSRYADAIADSGLDYSRYLTVYSTARAFSSEADAIYHNDVNDPRYSGDNIRAVVLDLPINELKLHDGSLDLPQKKLPGRMPGNAKSLPGLVPAKYVVGIVKAEKNKEKSDEVVRPQDRFFRELGDYFTNAEARRKEREQKGEQ
jgi:hypothetical protein